MILVVLVVIVGAAGVGYLLFSRPQTRVPAPIIDGSSGTSSSSLQTYGLEKYPGARPLALSASGEPDAVTVFETSDSPEQVIGYYRVRFPVAQLDATEEGSTLTADMGGRQVEVKAEALANGSRVTIRISR